MQGHSHDLQYTQLRAHPLIDSLTDSLAHPVIHDSNIVIITTVYIYIDAVISDGLPGRHGSLRPRLLVASSVRAGPPSRLGIRRWKIFLNCIHLIGRERSLVAALHVPRDRDGDILLRHGWCPGASTLSE